tara:strand:- start:164 stop:883 length:720 start_codon:yes stop_codon:yes gene_type:complete
VRHSLIAKLIGFFLLCPISINSSLSKNVDNQLLSNQLEKILNQKNPDLHNDLFLKKSLKQFKKQYLDFSKNHKEAKWVIKTISNHPNKIFLDIKIKSTREIGDQIYNLNSKQTVKIEKDRNKIKSFKVINEESILSSKNSPLIVKIIAPNQVLTGERYEVNLIIEKPLDNSLIASGMIVLKNKENMNTSNDLFGIKPNQSGGLFKYIQAPLEPGFQTISAIIINREGIYSITKKIKVSL